MFEQSPRLNPLDSQVLLVERELNRGQLSQEWQTMTHQLRDLAQRAQSVTAWASATVLCWPGWQP